MMTSTQAFGWRSWLAFVLALAVLVGLGTWQMQRRTWKEGVLADISARGAAAPLAALPALDCIDCEFRRISIAGRFISDSERHVFISVPRQPSGVGGPGYWVFAVVETGGQQLYVNRGFVPEGDKAIRREVPADLIRIEGVVRRPELRGRFSNANDRARNIYFVRSPAEFIGPTNDPTAAFRTDLYVDMTGPVPAGGLPLPMVGKIAIPNRHLEYALTWYALAATLIGIALVMNRR